MLVLRLGRGRRALQRNLRRSTVRPEGQGARSRLAGQGGFRLGQRVPKIMEICAKDRGALQLQIRKSRPARPEACPENQVNLSRKSNGAASLLGVAGER